MGPYVSTEPLMGHGEKNFENFLRAHVITSRAHAIPSTCAREVITWAR